ncbi:MAG: protoheme IX farnesyltransferase [Acidobacteria bacterium]|nr:protoheme IX farnesyltransferase [Acidobacteriota bacterium]
MTEHKKAEETVTEPRLRQPVAVAFLNLTKPRITLMVVLSALAGFALGARRPLDWERLIHFTFGIAVLSSGIGALNQYLERDLDSLMNRTKNRPLPLGAISPRLALFFGILLVVAAEIYLFGFVNPLTAAWGLVAMGSYLFIYTPLKTRTHWCTFIGAVPGALPPLLGWAASTDHVGIEALTLFAIMFLWQFPHFHAIATMYRDDYALAGIRMLPVVESDGRSTARQIVIYSLVLLPVSLLPTFLKFSGRIYLAGAVILGGWFISVSISTARSMSRHESRRLLKASVLYLPLLLGLMVLNH